MKFKDKTICGYKVRIYADRVGPENQIHGAVCIDVDNDTWYVHVWHNAGNISIHHESDYDLVIDEPEKVKLYLWAFKNQKGAWKQTAGYHAGLPPHLESATRLDETMIEVDDE